MTDKSEDLEKAARKYAGIPEDSPHDLKYCVQDKKAKYDAVLFGANLAKQQIMNDAISAKVTEIYYPTDSCLEIEATLPEDRFKDGDKVLIIKED